MVGTLLGDALGDALGVSLGDVLGEADGEMLGDRDGLALGCALGLPDGLALGRSGLGKSPCRGSRMIPTCHNCGAIFPPASWTSSTTRLQPSSAGPWRAGTRTE